MAGATGLVGHVIRRGSGASSLAWATHRSISVESKLLSRISAGASVIQVTATDADDATYGNSAKVVYSILEGQPYFSVDPETGE